MIKSLVNKYLKAALDELFINGGNMSMSVLGSDLFSESSIDLHHLTFRPDVFDAYLQPLRLVSGHLGTLKVEGVAEMALSIGKLRVQVENVFLLFEVDDQLDAERVQLLKKVLLELQGPGPIAPALLGDVLRKLLLGAVADKDPDVLKKRRSLLKGLNYVLNNVTVSIKTVHVRVETSSRKNAFRKTMCDALGATVASLRMFPKDRGNSSNSSSGSDRTKSEGLYVGLRGVQVYCDYDVESYTSGPGVTGHLTKDPTAPAHAHAPAPAPAPNPAASQASPAFHAAVLGHFTSRWKGEVHTGMVLPFDVDLAVNAEANKVRQARTRLCLRYPPHLHASLPPHLFSSTHTHAAHRPLLLDPGRHRAPRACPLRPAAT